MKAQKDAALGWVRPLKSTEDRILYGYCTPRRPLRGSVYLLLAIGLVVLSFRIGVERGNLLVWILATIPVLFATVLAIWGLLDLITKQLFDLEVDRRARTLALSMSTEQGEALAKVGFADVKAVDIAERRPLPGERGRIRWSVTLLLQVGRRIGLGMVESSAEAERLAAEFGGLIGVPTTRSVQERRDSA